MGEREEAPRTTLFVPLLDTRLATPPSPPSSTNATLFFLCFFASPHVHFFHYSVYCAPWCAFFHLLHAWPARGKSPRRGY